MLRNSSYRYQQIGKVSLWLLIPVGIIIFVIGIYLLFANTIIKSLAEDALTDASGAEVNIASVDHYLFPLTIDMRTLAFTDNAHPIRNKLEVARIKADIELMPLLSNKIIMDNLLVEEVAFSTAREFEGKVLRVPDSASAFAFPNLQDLPSVDEVLAISPLETTQAIAQADKAYVKYKQALEEKYATLPNKDKIEAYKAKISDIQNMDFNNPANIAKAKQWFDEVKLQIQEDKQNASAFIALAKLAKNEVDASVIALKRAPGQDFDLLKALVAGDEAAIGQVSQHLFGDKAQLYTQALVAAADMLRNAKNDGNNEPDQADTSGIPNVWIKNAQVSIKWLDQTITSNWQNITDQHAVVGSPTTFTIDAEKAAYWDAFTLNGEFEILAGAVNAQQQWDIQGLKLKDIVLIPESAKQKLNAAINSGLLAATGSLAIKNNQLDGKSLFNLSQLNLQASGTNNLTKAIAGVISEQKEIGLSGTFFGDIASPSIKIDSQFDKNLTATFGAGLANSPQLAELREKLNARINAQIGTSNAQLDSIDTLLSAAQGNTDALSDLLNAQLNNKIDEKKTDLIDKLKNRLFKD